MAREVTVSLPRGKQRSRESRRCREGRRIPRASTQETGSEPSPTSGLAIAAPSLPMTKGPTRLHSSPVQLADLEVTLPATFNNRHPEPAAPIHGFRNATRKVPKANSTLALPSQKIRPHPYPDIASRSGAIARVFLPLALLASSRSALDDVLVFALGTRRCNLHCQWPDLCEPALSSCHSILFLRNHRCHVPGTNCLSVHPGFETLTITLEFYVARIP